MRRGSRGGGHGRGSRLELVEGGLYLLPFTLVLFRRHLSGLVGVEAENIFAQFRSFELRMAMQDSPYLR